ncbi:hypothetical protein E3N88_29538 [Mikania micrantha]|uniref:Uncharacterized protein n=1 Tax=Mikania micrantha TaxID=192012 RepID=A0A5N6MJ51_9ASTR|nr:hypothetical protein E3N88_29538 [Mikania micrantha]
MIRDMYASTKKSVRALMGDTDYFLVEVGLHQGEDQGSMHLRQNKEKKIEMIRSREEKRRVGSCSKRIEPHSGRGEVKGRLRLTCDEQISQDLLVLHLSEDIIGDIISWRRRIKARDY